MMVEYLDLVQLKISYICDACQFISKYGSVMILHSEKHKEEVDISLEQKNRHPETSNVNNVQTDENNGDCELGNAACTISEPVLRNSETSDIASHNINETEREIEGNKTEVKSKYSCEVCGTTYKCKRLFIKHKCKRKRYPCKLKTQNFSKQNCTRKEIHNALLNPEQMDISTLNSICKECGKHYKCQRLFDKHVCNNARVQSSVEQDVIDTDDDKLSNVSSSNSEEEVYNEVDDESEREYSSENDDKPETTDGNQSEKANKKRTGKADKISDGKRGGNESGKRKKKMDRKLNENLNKNADGKLNGNPNENNDKKLNGNLIGKTDGKADEEETVILENQLECDICKKLFDNNQQLAKHKRYIHTDNPRHGLECEHCQEIIYGGEKCYKRHMRRHVGPFPFTCDECGKGFFVNSKKKTHMLLHKCELKSGSKRSYKCDKCEVVCSSVRGFFHHKREKHKKQKGLTGAEHHQCGICGKKIVGQYKNLLIHMRRHTGERPFVCEICDARFIETTLLKQHMITHHNSNPKPVLCDVCGKSFFYESALRRHKTIHKDVRDFACDIEDCDFKTKSKNSLQIHQRRMHITGKEHSCQFCNLRFYVKGELDAHVVYRHKSIWKCFVCGKHFDFLVKMRAHLTKDHPDYKPLQCQFCDYSAKRPYLLTRHLQVHHCSVKNASKYKDSWCCNYCNLVKLSKREYLNHLKDGHRLKNQNFSSENGAKEDNNNQITENNEDNQNEEMTTVEISENKDKHQTVQDLEQNDTVMNIQQSVINIQQPVSTLEDNDELITEEEAPADLGQNDLQSAQKNTPITKMDSFVEQSAMFVVTRPNTVDDNVQRKRSTAGVYEMAVYKIDGVTTFDSQFPEIFEDDAFKGNVGAEVVIE